MYLENTIIINSCMACVYLIFNAYWVMIFMRRIHCSRKYKKGAARCITDEESEFVNEQICYHYETEIWKYVYLLMIILSELSAGLFYMIAHLTENYVEDIRKHLRMNLSWNNTNLSKILHFGWNTHKSPKYGGYFVWTKWFLKRLGPPFPTSPFIEVSLHGN